MIYDREFGNLHNEARRRGSEPGGTLISVESPSSLDERNTESHIWLSLGLQAEMILVLRS